jgi:hypothetical protein
VYDQQRQIQQQQQQHIQQQPTGPVPPQVGLLAKGWVVGGVGRV